MIALLAGYGKRRLMTKLLSKAATQFAPDLCFHWISFSRLRFGLIRHEILSHRALFPLHPVTSGYIITSSRTFKKCQ